MFSFRKIWHTYDYNQSKLKERGGRTKYGFEKFYIDRITLTYLLLLTKLFSK